MTCKFILSGRIFSVVTFLLLTTLIVTAQNPVPFISQPLLPSAFAPSVPGLTFALTVNGTGFVSDSVVNWNGHPRTTAYVNGSTLYAYILSSDTEQAGTAWITVVNPTPGGGTSNTIFLPINNPTSTVSFEPRTNYTVGSNPQYIATADFARDGKLYWSPPTMAAATSRSCWETATAHFKVRDSTRSPATLRCRSLGISTGTESSILPCPTMAQ